MAEKSGKGVSFSGKNDSPAKSKRGRKPQSSNQDGTINFSFSSNGKSAPSSGQGKGGKGDKPARVNKTAGKEESRSFKFHVDQELPKNATCLMNCEAAHILQGIQEKMVILSDDPLIKIPVPFDKGLQLARSGIKYADAQLVRQALQPLTKHGVHDSELSIIANTCPESVDHVFALFPSLKGKKSLLTEPIREALSELAKLKAK